MTLSDARIMGSTGNRPFDASRIAVLTVTYHPEIARLEQQISALPSDALLVLVDNASSAIEVNEIRQLVACQPRAHVLRNETNLGLGAALNLGAAHVAKIAPMTEFLLLLDQDSVPHPGAIEQLHRAFLQLEREGQSVGCVGPRLIDQATGLQHGFHCIRGWRWARAFAGDDSATVVDCANLNGSGTLVRLSLFQQMGGLNEAMFIDHIDTDWSFRVLDAGFKLFGIPQATFDHCMGERGMRFWWFGWRAWPQRTPKRHYSLFRNAVYLLHQSYVPCVWKFWAVVKLVVTLLVHAIFDSQRISQVHNMVCGIYDSRNRAAFEKRN
ncbi:MAG: glycosyltransferase [Rhodanobacter sp.]